MANPSTIWAQLATPNSAAGSVPYVTTDGVTITADVVNFSYIDQTWNTLAGSQLWNQVSLTNGVRVNYADTTNAPATAVTINKVAGRLKIPAGQNTVTVTNSMVFANSIINLQLETADTTLTRVVVIPGAGFFQIFGNAAATGNTTLNFTVTNVF